MNRNTMSIRRHTVIRLCAGLVTAATMGGLGMAGAASASPAIAATAGVAHCNVIMVGGYSPCFPKPVYPGGTVNPGGPIRLV
jgi:hypothetical protein